jgi:type II secretory pathway pseudopilin PulG
MQTLKYPLAFRRANQGISLIIVLVMLVIIGITAATAMRTATSEQRATNNMRMETVAQQYAEAALRICEGQMKLASASRFAAFRSPLPVSPTLPADPRWRTPANWIAVTPPSGRYDLSANDNIYDSNNNPPTTYPQCLVELQTVPATPTPFTITVITARGFSPDYARNAGTGETTQGAVVWLQSIVNAE